MEQIKLRNIDETIYYEKLNNGLPVYMLVNKNVNTFYITFSVKYGSIHTDFKINGEEHHVHDGVAHFLEHVNFNEKENFTAHDYFRKIGSNINAFTTFDFTCYEVMGTSKFKSNLNHLLDYVQTPYFTKELVEKEKGIIVEEVKMGENDPGHKLYYGMNRCLYHNDKRKNLVTGTVDDVKNISVEELQDVYDTFYHPDNMFLIITGNFNPEEALRIIKDNQDKKKFIDYRKPEVMLLEEPSNVVKSYEEIEANVEIPKLKISYKMPYSLFKEYDKVSLNTYLNILCRCNFGNISDFKEELLKKELVNMIGANAEIFNDLITIDISIDSRDPLKVKDIILDKMKHLEISEDDILRRKRCNIASLIKDYDDIEYVNTDIAYQLVTYGKVIDNVYDIYNSLNIDDIRKIMNKLDLSNYSIVLLKPYEDK